MMKGRVFTVTTQSQSPAVVKFNMFSFGGKLSSVQVFWGRLASYGQIGLISDPQIYSKLQNGINDTKELENKIYTMMKGRETLYGDHTVPITSCSEVHWIYTRVILWKQRTENSRVYKSFGPPD